MSARRVFIIAAVMVLYTFLIGELGLTLGILIASDDLLWSVREDLWPMLLGSVTEPETIGFIWVPAAVCSATQVAFLLPALSPRSAAAPGGRPLMLSLVAAALVAGMLFAGLFSAVAELIYLARTGLTDAGDLVYGTSLEWLFADSRWGFWPFVLVSWALWTPLLWLFCRRMPAHRFHDRLVGRLFAGTVIEVLVVLPLDIIVRRKSSCYCATGSFTALLLSALALLWLAGPGIILALTSRRRRLWLEGHCPSCGYEKGPTPGPLCPECGVDWNQAIQSRSAT